MAQKNDGGSAFPALTPAGGELILGMSLLDYFAGQALAGMAGNLANHHYDPSSWAKAARDAYDAAGTMLEERGGETS